MLENVYYQQDDNTYYLKLDGVLRLIPNNQTFKNLFAQDFSSSLIPATNQFPNKSKVPFLKGNPLMNGASVYTIPNDQSLYFSDNYLWDLQKLVFRKIVNKSQFIKLGFVNTGTPWGGALPEIAVPLAINTSNNMNLQTNVSGGYLVYQYLCHRGYLNPYFASWASRGKQNIKNMIIESQNAINQLAGVIKVATPKFDPEYVMPNESNIVVRISCSTPNTVIYYTTDGTQPLAGISTIYRNGVPINVRSANTVLKAVAEAVDSPGVSSTQSVDYVPGRFPVSAPNPSVPAGDSKLNQIKVSLHCATPNVTIYYTTNGNTPTKSDSLYNGTPISLNLTTSNKTLKAFAYSNQYQTSSPVMSAEYRFVPAKMLAPFFRQVPPPVVIIPSCQIIINASEADSFIRYTTAPNGPSTEYEIPFNINIGAAPNKTMTVSAQATGTYGQLPSDTVSLTLKSDFPWKNCWLLSEDCNDTIGNVNLNNQNVVFQTDPYNSVPFSGYGNSAYFNGDSLLSTTNVSTLQSPTFTISLLAGVDKNVNDYVPLITLEKSDNGHDGPGIVLFADGNVQAQTIQSDGTYKIIKKQPKFLWPFPNLNHYVLIADGSNLSLYINGSLLGSVEYDGTINTNHCQRLCIGGEKGSSAPNSPILRPLTGNINKVLYSNVAMDKSLMWDLDLEVLLYM